MSKDFLLQVYNEVKRKGIIDDEIVRFLERMDSGNLFKVLDILKRKITRYTCKPSNRTFWTAIGKNNDDYLIYPKLYCSCFDFHMNVVIKKKRPYCKHLLAQVICEALDTFNELELKDKDFLNFIKSVN